MSHVLAPLVAGLLVCAVLCWPRRGSWEVGSARALLPVPPSSGDAWAGMPRRGWSRVRRRRPERRGGRRRKRRRRGGRGTVTPAEVLGLLEGLAPALRAGLAPADALTLLIRVNLGAEPDEEASAWQEELARVGARARDGEPLARVWRALAQTHRSPELMLLAQAWALSERLGSSLSEAVLTTTELVRERIRAGRRVDAASAGAKATMNLLTMLPLGGAVVAALLGISPVDLYARSPLAVGCLAAGSALLVLGRLMVRRMVRRSLTPEPLP